MQIILFDTSALRGRFYPLSYTKPFAAFQMGIFSMKEWWEKMTGKQVSLLTEDYLQPGYPLPENEWVYFVNAGLLPNRNIWNEIQNLQEGDLLKAREGQLLAAKANFDENEKLAFLQINYSERKVETDYIFIERPYQLLQNHARAIEEQFELIMQGKNSQKISSTNNIIAPENIFLEEGVQMEYVSLNASEGKIYIGKNALIMEGSMIRGAFALGENSVVKMGTKIYGATSTGKKCALGGEIKNTIFNHFSNKAHDGYLGDSIIGNWCNFGAGTSNSNIKNTANEVGVYDYFSKSMVAAGKKFGLLMGDYSRLAINSSINTGTSIGVCCNVFGDGLLPKHIPNFSWGISNQNSKYQIEKAMQHIQNWMALKAEKLSDWEIQTLQHIFDNADI